MAEVTEEDRKVLENWSRNEVADFFSFLDDLRESGATNMFAAGAYVEREFNIGKNEARQILTAWMHTFKRDVTPFDRAKQLQAP